VKILLDESLPARLAHELYGHKVTTVTREGWIGIKNGELLRLAEGEFDVFITADQNLQYQVNMARAKIPIIVLAAKTNRLADLKPLAPKILSALQNLKEGIIRVS
jgi:predicted nuclease of predicted toxin-antitoxin system